MIKFVYFDLGGVINRDFSANDKWKTMKNDLGVNTQEFEDWFAVKENELCEGKEHFDLNYEGKVITLDDFVSRFEKNETIWPLLDEFKSKYKIGLLTNMYPGMLDAIFESGVMPSIDWDVRVDSSTVGFKKPGTEIYKIAEEKAGFLGEEILFVDNTKKNLETAQSLGWQTFLYDSSDYVGSTEKLQSLNLG